MKNRSNENKDESIFKALDFVRRELPMRHPEIHCFDRVSRTPLYFAIVEENDGLLVRPEINTIYDGDNHDLITPIIMALGNDCLYRARFGAPYLNMN